MIDTNVLGKVFKESATNHAQFKPVKDWIIQGKGKVVYGGTRYISEIKGAYLDLFVQLKKAGKAVSISSNLVDTEEQIVANMISHADFDDQHLVGLLRASGCRLICSLDSRAFPYFTNNLFFTPASSKPRIYCKLKNSVLLCDKNIADLCKPCSPTTNHQKRIIGVK